MLEGKKCPCEVSETYTSSILIFCGGNKSHFVLDHTRINYHTLENINEVI